MKKDRSHEILVLWMDLDRAITNAKRAANSDMEILPWTCSDENVRAIWGKLTEPQNMHTLEAWLEVSSRENSRVWTQAALDECKRRASEL